MPPFDFSVSALWGAENITRFGWELIFFVLRVLVVLCAMELYGARLVAIYMRAKLRVIDEELDRKGP